MAETNTRTGSAFFQPTRLPLPFLQMREVWMASLGCTPVRYVDTVCREGPRRQHTASSYDDSDCTLLRTESVLVSERRGRDVPRHVPSWQKETPTVDPVDAAPTTFPIICIRTVVIVVRRHLPVLLSFFTLGEV
jgi:hypothetical protein